MNKCNSSDKTKSRLVYKEASQQKHESLRKVRNISYQTEYAIAVSELLTDIEAPASVIKAANEKLRSELDAEFVYNKIKQIVAYHSGRKSRTKEIIYDFKAIAEAIGQIGEKCEHKPVISYRNIDTIELSGQYISDAMKDDVDKLLQPYTVSVLEGGTGMGKTTLIAYDVLKRIKDSGKKAILLSNRVCLNKASKREICKALGVEYQMDMFSEEGINSDFRVIASCIYVISYQQAAAMFFNDQIEKDNRNRYDPVNEFGIMKKLPYHCDMIIQDEAHWYVSDSNFSAINAFLFDALLKKYPQAAKCFISATMSEDLMDELDNYMARIEETPLKKIERHNFTNSYGFENPYAVKSALHYKFSRNEEQVIHSLAEVDSFSDLIPQIVKTAGPKEKYILFMDSKEEAKKLRDEINKQLVSDTGIPTAVFVSAESKISKDVDHDILQQLIEENKFSCHVLLCSSVIDSGLSIKDKNVKHIALPPYAPDTFIQAFGRDRMRDIRKTIYLRKITPKDIGKYLGRAKKILELAEAFEQKDWWKVNTQFADEFYKSFMILPDGTLSINRFAVNYSKRSLDFFTEVKENLEEDRYAYLKLQAQWLNLPESSVQSIIDKNEELFISFIDEYRNNYPDGMSKEVFTEFREKFKENCLKWLMPIADARADRTWGLDIIERTLEFNGLTQYTIEEKRKGAGGKDGTFYYVKKAEEITL